MIRKSTATLVLALALVLVLAISACAQLNPRVQRPQRPKAQQQAQGGAADWLGGLAGAREHIGAFASLERILLPPNRREMQMMGMILNPSEEQKAQIKALYKAFFEAVKAVAPLKQEGIKAVLAGLAQPNPNKSDLEACAARVAQADQAIVSAELDFWIGLKGILGPQQQAQVQMMFQERMQREMNPRQGGPGGPPPGGQPGPPPPQQ